MILILVIFFRDAESLLAKGDIVIGISTSGKSDNVIKALDFAKKNKNYTCLLTGKNKINKNYNSIISIPSQKLREFKSVIF